MARLFTLDEATALLPTIQPILQRIMDLRIRLGRAEQDVASLHWKARTNGHVTHAGSGGDGLRGQTGPAGTSSGEGASVEDSSRESGSGEGPSQRTVLRNELNAALVQLHDLGVELKDPALGLIDFRSLRDGRVVYLCWRIGEPTITYWHELHAGFASRQPL